MALPARRKIDRRGARSELGNLVRIIAGRIGRSPGAQPTTRPRLPETVVIIAVIVTAARRNRTEIPKPAEVADRMLVTTDLGEQLIVLRSGRQTPPALNPTLVADITADITLIDVSARNSVTGTVGI